VWIANRLTIARLVRRGEHHEALEAKNFVGSWVSQISRLERYRDVDAGGNVLAAEAARELDLEFDATFRASYSRIARVIARVVRDRSRAEELAVDVFVKWWRHKDARGDRTAAWLSRTAVNLALDELRRQARHVRYERGLGALFRSPPTPEEIRAAEDEQQRVRSVLATLSRRDASLLLLRSDGSSYEDVGNALGIKATSVGTLIIRAQRAFRTEYVRRYGQQ
jgi:RNA polymerase sigma-70 factor (ECF subfamily)